MPIDYLQRIPYHELDFEATRSRGPGGQHVNRTNSAVVLRWSPGNSTAFSEYELRLLLQRLPLTDSGEVLIRSEQFRSQDQNKSACLQKLAAMLERALHVAKKRIKTRPTRSSQRKRIDQKSRTGEIKKGRRKVHGDD